MRGVFEWWAYKMVGLQDGGLTRWWVYRMVGFSSSHAGVMCHITPPRFREPDMAVVTWPCHPSKNGPNSVFTVTLIYVRLALVT